MISPSRPTLHTEYLDVSFDGIKRAADLIRYGNIVAFGTETVYGLGALSSSRSAVSRIFSAKGRPSFNPLINHFANTSRAFSEANLDIPLASLALSLAKNFWPGPLTLVLPRHTDSRICDIASASLPSVALRVPQGRAVQELLHLINEPVAAPSANRSGHISPSTAAHVLQDLDGRINGVLDTGSCSVGLESTVVDLTGSHPVLLRPGGITRESLEKICGRITLSNTSSPLQPTSPGQISSHYAPSLPVRLNAHTLHDHEALLAFGDISKLNTTQRLVWNLSSSGNLTEAASRLFTGLHFLDREAKRRGLKGIAVSPIPTHDMGHALHDRLQRAAAPRSIQYEGISDG